MAIGGETIGRAYVRILADGSGFGDDVRRQMRANDGDFEQAGEQSSAAYRRGFSREMRKNGVLPQRDIDNAVREGAGRWDAGGHVLGSAMLDGVRDELEARFPNDVGTTIFRNLRDQFERGQIDFTGLKRSLRNLRPEVAKATDDIIADQKSRFADLGRAVEDYGNTLMKTRNARRHLQAELEGLHRVMPDNVRDTDQMRRRFAELQGILTPTGNRLQRMRDRFVQTGTVIGKFFGRGSRNNFLNFFGGFVSLAPRIIGGLTGATRAVTGFTQQLMGAYRAGETVREGIGNVISGLGSLAAAGLPGLAAAAISVGAAIQVVIALLPALGAAVSLVLGLVLTLAGSLGFALVGALVAVAGALVPFAAALGVGAIALMGLDKKGKVFKTLKADFTDLQKATQKALFGEKQEGLENISHLLKGLQPLVVAVAKAMKPMLDSLGKAAESKGFADMIDHLATVIPPMVTALGKIAGNIGTFLGEAFLAATPMISEFLGWLTGVTQGMADFGKGGDSSGLSKFFQDAWTSAKKVGGLILDIADGIGILLGAGKETGDSIFDDIAKKVQEIVKWLSSPEGQKALAQWFADAKKLAGQLGQVVTKVIEFVDALDTPTSRLMLESILDAVIGLIGFLAKAAGAWDKWNTAVLTFAANTINTIGALPAMFSGWWASIEATFNIFIQNVQSAWSTFVSEIGTALSDTVNDIAGFLAPAWNAILTGVKLFVQGFIGVFVDLYNEIVGHSIVPDLVRDIVGWFARLPGMIAAVLGDLGGKFVTWLAGVPGKIQSSVGLVVGAFGGLAGKAIARAGNIVSAFASWVKGLPAKAKAIATSVATGFVGLASKIISRAGSITAAFARWVAGLPGKAKSIANSIVSGFGGLAGKIISRAGSITAAFGRWVSSLAGKAKTAANNIVNAFSGVAGKIISKMGSLASKLSAWGSSAVSKAKGVASNIVSAFSGLASRIVKAIGDIVPKIRMPNIKVPTVVAKVITPKKAAGGIVNGAQIVTVGEAGPEAIVPLNRALNRVDPAVRALSAFAQGMSAPSSSGSSVPSIGRNIDVGGIVINTPTEDPRAVASEVVNRMTFAAYI